MSVGLPISRTEIDISSGDTARAFQRAFEDAAIMQFYLAGEAELVALGYTTQEVAILITPTTAWNSSGGSGSPGGRADRERLPRVCPPALGVGAF